MTIRSYRSASLFALLAASVPLTAAASTYHYVNWTAADVAGGTATGFIPVVGDAGVTVTFTATTDDGGPGDLYGAQTGETGNSFWTWDDAGAYTSAQVENAPPNGDIIQLSGGENELYTVTLSEPVVDPIMAIVSLGAANRTITYNFNAPFTIVSQGADEWGGDSTSLVQLPNNVLQGAEGSGTIQFIGTFSSFSWTVPVPESWHGFTFGILSTESLYDGGGPDGSSVPVDGNGSDAGAATDASALDGAPSSSGDAGSQSDGSAAADAGHALDSGIVDAATGGVDATAGGGASDAGGYDAATGPAADGGTAGPVVSPPSTKSGCSCSTAPSNSPPAMLPLGFLAVVLSLTGRRIHRSRGSRSAP